MALGLAKGSTGARKRLLAGWAAPPPRGEVFLSLGGGGPAGTHPREVHPHRGASLGTQK